VRVFRVVDVATTHVLSVAVWHVVPNRFLLDGIKFLLPLFSLRWLAKIDAFFDRSILFFGIRLVLDVVFLITESCARNALTTPLQVIAEE
jgi:hypothetical protein